MENQYTAPSLIVTETGFESIEQAVLFCGALLVQNGYAESGYPAAMVETVKQLGTFAALAPHILFPHASYDFGGIKPGAAFVRLKEPLDFNGSNGPIRLIAGFCGNDAQSHMQVLSWLANIFSNPNALEKILAFETADEVYAFLNQLGNDKTSRGSQW